MKRNGHHEGCDCRDCMRAIDENNRRPIYGRTGWMGDVSGNPFGPFEGRPDDPDANTPSPEAKP